MTAADELIVGRYRLVRQLAGGGMGTVWEGWDERLHREVAIKQLHAQPGLNAQAAALANDRALREARITARLHHPFAITVYDVVEHHGQPCLIMEYLKSTSLQSIVSVRRSLPPREVARIGAQVAAALVGAHRAGIVHRDVKPGNVLIAEDGTAKLTDFGISHAVGDLTLTSTGMVTGTPAFLAPEVARGRESDFASDVFSLGSTLYAAVEGTPPFGAEENPMAVLHKVASGQVIAPRQAGELTPLLVRMLAVDPGRRPPMVDVATALDSVHRLGVLPPAFRDLPTDTPTTAGPVLPTAEDRLTSTVAMPAVPVANTPTSRAVAPNAASGARRRRGLSKLALAALVAAALVVLAAVAVGVLLLADGKGSGGTSPSTSSGPSPSARATSNSSSDRASTSVPTSTAASLTPTTAPATTAPPTTAPPTTAPATTAPATTAPPATRVTSVVPSTTVPTISTAGSTPAAPTSAAVAISSPVGALSPPAPPVPPSVPVP